MSKIILFSVVGACAVSYAGMEAASISNAVAEELTHEIRPGGVTQSAFWNANAMRFMYPPSIEFLPVAGAAAYEMTVIDAIGRKFSWKSNDPVARLSPHWTELATGYVNLLVEAIGAKGENLGKTQGRFFWKKAAFTGNYPPAARTYREAADRVYGYILDSAPLKDWDWEGQFEDVVPMPKYSNLTKHSACDTAMFCLERFPGDKRRLAEARDVLRFAEDQFVEWERPFVGIGGRPLQWGVNAKLTWMMDETHIRKAVYPSVLEQYRCYVPISSSSSKLIRTYLALYRAEGKTLDLEKARALGDAMTRAQRPDGSIPTTLDPAAPYSGDWLNCLIADAAALNELASRPGLTASFDSKRDCESGILVTVGKQTVRN